MQLRLYPHQQQVLTETEGQNRVAYYLDMGLGKTFVGAKKAISLMTNVVLVICQKSKISDWIEHFETYYATNEKDYCCKDLIFDLSNGKQFKQFILEAQEAAEPNEIYDEWTGQTYHQENLYPYMVIGVINYELVFRRSELLKLRHFTMMLDESSMITNPSAKRTKFIHKMNADNVILLSGTPTGGKYEKLWSQLKLLGWNISKKLFYKQYVVTDWIEDGSGFKIPVVVGYKNVDRLKVKLKQYGCIFMKTEDVFDLPDKITIPIMVKNTKEFGYFMRNSIVELPDGTELIGDTTLNKRLYARQLCGQYSAAKLAAFKDLVESTDDRLIVFYNFNEELFKIKSIVEELEKPVSIVNGSIKDLEAYENESDSVTFVQYQAGSMGLNLQKSNKIIYFTLPQSSEHFEQSMKRIHRIGQKNNCFYYLLMVENSVEEDILETLKMRKDYDDELFKKYESNS